MAGFYDGVSLGGIWDAMTGGGTPTGTADDKQVMPNPYAGFEPKNTLRATADALMDTRSAIRGESTPQDSQEASQGAIPTPSTQPQASTPQAPQSQFDKASLFRTQTGAADAKKQQQDHIDASQQKVADDAVKGGNVPTAANQDPAGSLADKNQNIQSGVGNPITGQNNPSVPDPLTPDQQKNALLDQAGKQTFQSMNTIGNWYESKSFLMGMMQTGLALLDGKGYSESFQLGSQYFDQHYGMEQRQSWGDDLLNKGYDRQQIEEWIRTGDSKTLQSPAELAQQAQIGNLKLQSAQASLQGQQLQNQALAATQTPEALQAAAEDRDITNQYKKAQAAQMTAEAQWKSSPEYVQGQRDLLQSQIDQNRAQTGKISAAGQTGGINVYEDPNTHMKTNLGGAPLIPGSSVYPVVDSRNHYQEKKGFYMGLDTKTGKPVSVPVNIQQYERVATSADNTIQAVNNFKVEGVSLAGPTGEFNRDFLDNFGTRNKADQISILNQLEGYQHNLALAQASLEIGGGRPTNADVEAAAASFPQYIDRKTGEPVTVSKERMQAMFENTLRQAAQIHNTAANAATGNYEANQPERYNPQSQVARGQRMFDPKSGKWFIATKSGAVGDRIWAIDPNQSNN